MDLCRLLQNQRPIEGWDVSGINDLSYLFYEVHPPSCNPDISKWDVSNVEIFVRFYLHIEIAC